MASLKENIDSVVNAALKAYESKCRLKGLELLDDMHRDGLLNHQQFFEYREKFDAMYKEGREELIQR